MQGVEVFVDDMIITGDNEEEHDRWSIVMGQENKMWC